jgi:phage regulator Rha-like protein
MKQTQLSAAVATAFSNAGTMTMTSQEIAELCDKQHKNVLTDIKTMLEGLELMSSEFSDDIPVQGPNGGVRMSPIFRLPKDLTLTLVSGYSVKLRYKIIKRWEELEAAEKTRIANMTREEFILLLLETERARMRAEAAASAALVELDEVRSGNTLFPHPEWTNGIGLAVTKIRATYAPYLSIPDINTILHYAGHPLTKYKLQYAAEDSINGNLDMYVEEGLEESFAQFWREAKHDVNASLNGITVRHPCLGKKVVRIRKELAVLFLDYTKSHFEG